MVNDFNKKVIDYGKRKDLCFNDIQIIRDDKTGFEAYFKAHKVKLDHKKRRKLTKFNLLTKKQKSPFVKIIIKNILIFIFLNWIKALRLKL